MKKQDDLSVGLKTTHVFYNISVLDKIVNYDFTQHTLEVPIRL